MTYRITINAPYPARISIPYGLPGPSNAPNNDVIADGSRGVIEVDSSSIANQGVVFDQRLCAVSDVHSIPEVIGKNRVADRRATAVNREWIEKKACRKDALHEDV